MTPLRPEGREGMSCEKSEGVGKLERTLGQKEQHLHHPEAGEHFGNSKSGKSHGDRWRSWQKGV